MSCVSCETVAWGYVNRLPHRITVVQRLNDHETIDTSLEPGECIDPSFGRNHAFDLLAANRRILAHYNPSDLRVTGRERFSYVVIRRGRVTVEAEVQALEGLPAASIANSKREPLDMLDRSEIKRICRSLLGAPDSDTDRIFRQQLTPYLRTKEELEHRQPLICAGQLCGGIVRLRDDATISYGFLHVPSERGMKGGYFDDTPDIEIKGNNRIETVVFIRHGKVIFGIGSSGKPEAP
jgi:hypothetical protein